jgi:ribosomal protein S18 acetylase RimI-like enzyme
VAGLDPNQSTLPNRVFLFPAETRWKVPHMSGTADYSVKERLRDGRELEIRALRPEDQADMLAAIGRTGTQSLQRRFFGAKRGFSDREIAFFMNIDFINHVALVALVAENERPTIAGGGRYIVVQPGRAEVAFLVVDGYQGLGIGSTLAGHLNGLARQSGLEELVADVLPENTAMLKLFKRLGFTPGPKREPQVIHLVLPLA